MAGEGRKFVRALEKGLTVAVKAGKGFVREVVEAIDEAPKAFERFGEAIEEVVEHADRGTDEECRHCEGTGHIDKGFESYRCNYCATHYWAQSMPHKGVWHCCPKGSDTALCDVRVSGRNPEIEEPRDDVCETCSEKARELELP